MATLDWKLDMVGTLKLEDARHEPGYSSLVILSADLLLVIDNKANTLRFHSCPDGKLLASSDILSGPQDVCLVNGIGTQVAVAQLDGCITILSVESAGRPAVIKIRQLRLLDVTSEFKHCYGLRALKSGEKLIVSGSKWDNDSCEDWICWGLVSVVDGHVSTVVKICRGAGYSYLHTSLDDSTVYTSCYAGYDSEYNGVHAFNVMDGKKKFFYHHSDLKRPEGITVDRRGFIYVCNWYCPGIHQLTPEGNLVTVHSQGMLPWPQAIYCREQEEKLYVTTWWSNEIRTFLPVWREKKVSPAELLKMDTRSLQIYKEALQNESERVYNIRVILIGHMGDGKTTLIKRLLGKEVDISNRVSTEGIDVHTECCRVSLATGEWTTQENNLEHDYQLYRLAKIINEKQSRFNIADEEQEERSPESNVRDHAADRNALVSVSDFGGQFAFYTTHQMFLTPRAIYLLVLDLSRGIYDLVEDECYFDIEGSMKYRLHGQVEVWMNTIHSCASFPVSGSPPVILVGTHVDQILQDKRYEIYERCFMQIRSFLRDKPSRFHLVDEDFAIDNTVVDSKLEDLKRKIVEVASQQPYWGEEIPAYWLLLEQQLKRLRDTGVKVISYDDLENLNKEGTVGIESSEEILSGTVRIDGSAELDLFLRYLHETGTVIYFSVEELREKIVLDQQWLIDALKSLITAEMFIRRTNLDITNKWHEFRYKGMITPELIDAIWTKDRFPEFHDNKELILLFMERLNIIVKPRVYNEDGSEIRVEKYFLAPSMLRQLTPREIISPELNPRMESSSVLCYVFLEKFLPTAIFHRLLATCVARWPVATRKTENMAECLIFCDCCVFVLDHSHRLTLHFREYVIFVRITRKGIKEKTPSSMLCIEVREFITTNLLKIIGCLGQSLKFEYFIQCPDYSGDSINSLIPVSILKECAEVCCQLHDNMIESYKLLKFWFEAEEQSGNSDACQSQGKEYAGDELKRQLEASATSRLQVPEVQATTSRTAASSPVSAAESRTGNVFEYSDDASSAGRLPSPPTSDTDRFMRIAYLLLDVGSRVLRQLLSHHTVTSTCTLDQYLAKNMSTLNRLRRVFNQSHMNIMFPPNGDNTNLDDYDITLLFALIQNIVPTLSRQKKDMIRRLRDERNKLYGHAESCQINANDFQTYWNDISSTLTTLSQQCGDAAFEVKILQEIQHTQVSAIPAKYTQNKVDMLETVKDELQNVTSRLQALVSKEKPSAGKF